MYIGCLLLLLIVAFLFVINFIGSILNFIGNIIIYIWDSICNLFRKKEHKKKTQNPFGAEKSDSSHNKTSENTSDTHPRKIFDASDGEYIDFEEIK